MNEKILKKLSDAILNTPNASDYPRLVAINAVKALLEPDQDMLKAGINQLFFDEDCSSIYLAMIGSIINE